MLTAARNAVQTAWTMVISTLAGHCGHWSTLSDLVLPSCESLSIILDNRLFMAEQVTAICRACYYQLRQLRSVVQSLTPEASKTLVHVFISCHLDNCNASLYGIADNQFQRLQSVQNAAARLVTGSRRSEQITPVLRSLHWLPHR